MMAHETFARLTIGLTRATVKHCHNWVEPTADLGQRRIYCGRSESCAGPNAGTHNGVRLTAGNAPTRQRFACELVCVTRLGECRTHASRDREPGNRADAVP